MDRLNNEIDRIRANVRLNDFMRNLLYGLKLWHVDSLRNISMSGSGHVNYCFVKNLFRAPDSIASISSVPVLIMHSKTDEKIVISYQLSVNFLLFCCSPGKFSQCVCDFLKWFFTALNVVSFCHVNRVIIRQPYLSVFIFIS